MESFRKPKNPSSPSYSHPPSLDYLSELGLDYEWQNAWLENGSMFPFESHDSFLDTFIASGEISSTDKEAAKIEKKCIFPHINIPVSMKTTTNIRPYSGLHRSASSSPKTTTSPTFANVFSSSISPLSPSSQLLSPATKRVKIQHGSKDHLAFSNDMSAHPLIFEKDADMMLTSKKRKSIQAVCDDMKVLLKLPVDYSKLDTLNHVLELMEQGKLTFG